MINKNNGNSKKVNKDRNKINQNRLQNNIYKA